jgi:hypothetical protein
MEERDVRVGSERCFGCGTKTPEPSTDQLVAFAKSEACEPGGGYMETFDHWAPLGWSRLDESYLCPSCSSKMLAALDKKGAS